MIAFLTPTSATYSYFVASFSFTAVITLYIARALHFAVFNDPYLMNLFPFEQNDHAALETVVQLLNHQALAGNLPAIEFARLSRLLDNNLQALQSAIHTAVNFGDVDLNFLTPEILLSVSAISGAAFRVHDRLTRQEGDNT